MKVTRLLLGAFALLLLLPHRVMAENIDVYPTTWNYGGMELNSSDYLSRSLQREHPSLTTIGIDTNFERPATFVHECDAEALLPQIGRGSKPADASSINAADCEVSPTSRRSLSGEALFEPFSRDPSLSQEEMCAIESCQLASMVPIFCITYACPSLTVMTLNVRVHPFGIFPRDLDDPPHSWEERVPRIAEMLRRYKAGRGPHIIGMQEVRGEDYPQQLRDLRAQLPTYQSAYSIRGGLIDGDEGVALFWRPDRIELIESDELIMTEPDRREAGGCQGVRYPINRNLIWGYFRDRLVDKTFYVYNLHIGGKTGQCQDIGTGIIIADYIAQRADVEAPVILMGDFNLGRNPVWGHPDIVATFDQAYTMLIDRTGLVNSYLTQHPYESALGSYSGWENARDQRLIDHVLVSPDFRVLDADIDRTMFTSNGSPVDCYELRDGVCTSTGHLAREELRHYSDHWAVWARLVW